MQITLRNFFVTYMHYFAISIGSLVAKKNCLFVVKDGHHASKDANDSAMGWMIASVPGAFRSRAARKIKFLQLRRTKCPTAAFGTLILQSESEGSSKRTDLPCS